MDPEYIKSIMWLIVMIGLLVTEAFTFNMTTIWFALGALVTLIVSLFTSNIVVQLTVFAVVSFAAFFLTKPFVRKILANRGERTNSDMLIGKTAVVRERICNPVQTGVVYVDGKEWTARLTDDSVTAEVNEVVGIVAIAGVKLIVQKIS